MTYQQTINAINTLNHIIKTKNLTSQETRDLIIQRETIWTNYIKN